MYYLRLLLDASRVASFLITSSQRDGICILLCWGVLITCNKIECNTVSIPFVASKVIIVIVDWQLVFCGQKLKKVSHFL